MKLSRLKRSLVTMTFGLAFGRALGFIQGVMLARTLGQESLGLYVTLVMTFGFLTRITDMGLPHSTAYHLRMTPDAMPGLLRSILYHGLGCVLPASLLVWGVTMLPLPISEPLRNSPGLQAAAYASIILGASGNILPLFLMASGSYQSYVTYINTAAALQMAVQFAVFLVFGPTYIGFFMAIVVSQAAMVTSLAIVLVRRKRMISKPVEIGTRSFYGFGIKAQWGIMMKLANTQLEVPLIASVIAPTLVSQYSVGATLREATLMPQSAYAGILQNLLVEKRKRTDGGGRLLLIKAMFLQLCLSIILFLAALALLPALIPLIYGPAFAQAANVAAILVFGTIFSCLSSLCWTDFYAHGRPQITSAAQTFSGLLGPVLIIFSASHWGPIGAGISSVCCHLLTFGISFALCCRMNRFTAADFLKAGRELPALIGDILSRSKAARGGA